MHVVIVGAGEVGRYLAEILAEERQDVCIIEQNERVARTVADSLDAQVVVGTGVSRRVLKRAGIERAKLLLAVTEVDEVNLVCAMTAERMSEDCRTVARVRDRRYLFGSDALTAKDYGIDLILGPELAVAAQVVGVLGYAGPGQISTLADGKVQLLNLPVEPHSTLAFATAAEIAAEMPSHSLIAAVLGDQGLRIPGPEDRFQVHERVFILAAAGEVNDVLQLMGSKQYHARRVLIVGGGNIGFQVASALEQLHFDVTVVEHDPERAEELAARLDRSLVIGGDGTDPVLLGEQIREGHEAVVILIDDDDASLLAGIVCNHYGAKKIVVRVDNPEYSPIARNFGVDALISPRRAVADAILRFVRRSHILATTMLGNHEGEVIDFALAERPGSGLIGKPLASIKMPKNSLLTVISHEGELLVPERHPEALLHEGDHVFVVALREAVAKVEEIFG